MSKPITAATAMILAEECMIRLDEPVDRLLPELADRRVLARPDGALDDTVPAQRPITVRDLLTFRLGYGMDFTAFGRQPLLVAMADLELGTGPPAPACRRRRTSGCAGSARCRSSHQPGARWLYHTGADVLGVLVARAAGMPSRTCSVTGCSFLGMTDTGFAGRTADLDRFGPCFVTDPDSGGRGVYDPADGQWSTPPAFQGGGARPVSTVDDYLAFATMLAPAAQREGGASCPGRPSS